MSRAPFDLNYTHEMVACAVPAATSRSPRHAEARDLTARLRCLKALNDAERATKSGRRVH